MSMLCAYMLQISSTSTFFLVFEYLTSWYPPFWLFSTIHQLILYRSRSFFIHCITTSHIHYLRDMIRYSLLPDTPPPYTYNCLKLYSRSVIQATQRNKNSLIPNLKVDLCTRWRFWSAHVCFKHIICNCAVVYEFEIIEDLGVLVSRNITVYSEYDRLLFTLK